MTGTTLGVTTETFQYNTFGEPTHQTAQVNGSITRDNLGRITQRIETIDGITRVFEYGYNLAGRLWQVLRCVRDNKPFSRRMAFERFDQTNGCRPPFSRLAEGVFPARAHESENSTLITRFDLCLLTCNP